MATPLLTYVGYTCGTNAAQANGTPTVAGFTAAYQATGPGAPAGTGTQYSRCIKYFPNNSEGYAGFPTNWANLTNLVAIIASATTTVIPIIVWGSKGAGNPGLSAPPATGPNSIQSFLQSLPAGQPCAWNFVSEVEAGTDISASGYVGVVQTFSNNLNTALAAQRTATGSGFWNRSNFFYVHAARMDHYSANPGDQSYIPNAGTCDCYGADLYRYGTSTGQPASSDPRFQGFVQAVHGKIGTNVSFGFPEYGIDTTQFTDAQVANIMAQDFAYMTGSSRPGVLPVLFWNYWYQHMASGKVFNFTAANAVAQWQKIVAYSLSQQGQNVITVTNPGLQTSIVNQPASLQINASDSGGPSLPLTYSLGNTLLPLGLHLNQNTGLITGQPTTPGTTTAISVTVTDGTGAFGSSGNFSWQVNSPTTETVTVINPGTQTSTRHAPITPLNIQASDSLGLTLTYTQLNLPAGLSINSMNGSITGIPTTVSAPLVTVTATSPTPVAASQNFTWNIIPSVVTVTSPGNQTSIQNETITPLTIHATDTAPLSLTFTDPGVTLPTGLTISAGGVVSGTATAAGTFNVSITVTDTDGVIGTTAFTWTVGAVTVTVTNPGPIINNTLDVVSLQITARDSADNTLTYSDGGTLPPGLVIGGSSGLITGQPTTAGIYTVTITASDAVAVVSGSATFTWTINQAATVLVVSIAPAAGTDIFGNTYPAGVTIGPTGGTQTTIGLNGTLHYNAPVFTMPAMANGWTVAAAAPVGHATYALDVLGNLIVSWQRLVPGTVTDGTLIWPVGSLPAAFRPATSRRIVAYTDIPAAGKGTCLGIGSNGAVSVFGVGATATRVDLFATIPLSF